MRGCALRPRVRGSPRSVIQALLLCATLLAHPLSMSSSRVVVDGPRVAVTIRCQELTLIESVRVDADEDMRITSAEIEARREELGRYLLAHYRVAADPEGESGKGTLLTGRLAGMRLLEGEEAKALFTARLVEFELSFEAASAPRTLRLDVDVFRESNPLHRDHAQIVWNGSTPEERSLWVEDPTWVFAPSAAPRSAFGSYVELGIEHILLGWDHIAFVIALVVASRGIRSVLGVVTAFTLAHSITLALASLGVVTVPSSLVEPAIAASIAFVGFSNVLSRRTRTLWPEAFGFGLVHGLGFAGSIAETLASEKQKVLALVGFNLGVEIGQLGIVAGLVVVLALVRRFAHRPEAEPALAPRWVRVAASSVVGVLGVYWFVSRVAGA